MTNMQIVFAIFALLVLGAAIGINFLPEPLRTKVQDWLGA